MILGKFQLIEEIGHGGFGTVYRANDTTLDRIVALKILHEQYLSDQKFIESFKREARMMARVSHPNVVQIFEVGDLEGQIYIAMQYFDGGNLDQKIQAGVPLPLKDAIRMLSQTARGLEAGHKIGLVHRDVKPANILYNREGYIAISDFGVAKSIKQSSPETTNSFNQFAGTPYYIPPELWQSEGNPSPAADVYSLACVFYEALTAEILFAGETYEHVLTRHVLEAPVFSQALPECLVDTLNVALAKNPSDRFQTMNDFLAAVRGALERQPRRSAGTSTPQEPTSVIEELPKPLAPGEITFDELVRRSQRKTTAQSAVTKPAPVIQPTPAPVRPRVPTEQPQIQKPEPKQEPPALVPIIRPPQVKEQAPEPIAEKSPALAAPIIETEASLPEIAAELPEAPDVVGFSEDESVEDFFARTLDEPLETAELVLREVEETPTPEEPEDDLILEDWLAKEAATEAPAVDEAPVTDGGEDVPLPLEEGVATEEEGSDELEAEVEPVPLAEEIVGEIVVETQAEAQQPAIVEELVPEEVETAVVAAEETAAVKEMAEEAVVKTPVEAEEPVGDEEIVSEEIEVTPEEVEEPAAVAAIISELAGDTLAEADQVIPVEQDLIITADETDFQEDQGESSQEVIFNPAPQTQVDEEAVEDPLPEIPAEEAAIAGALASQMEIELDEPNDEVVVEPASQMPQEARSFSPTEDRITQTLKEREDQLAHNAATSKFDQSWEKGESSESKRKPKFILLITFGGIALMALAFLVFSGQARDLFGGKPSNTPTFTLTLLPSNTAAAPVIILTRTSTSIVLPSSTRTNTQTDTTATPQTPARTATDTTTPYPTTLATSTPYPTARPTDRPTNPPNIPTATFAPPIATIAPPTATIPQPTAVPPTATLPPADTPVPTRGPTPTPP